MDLRAGDNTIEQVRDGRGRWVPGGRSPNPGGRPAALREVRALAREHTERAVQRLSDLLDDEDGRVVAAAASILLAYGWGRPPHAIVADVTVTPRVDRQALEDEIVARIGALAAAEVPAGTDHLPPRQEGVDSLPGSESLEHRGAPRGAIEVVP